MSDELLFENKWIQVLERDDWYTFTHNPATDGKAIMVLVYDFNDPDDLKLLGRYEHNPAHTGGSRSPKDSSMELTSITGSYEKDMTLEEVAIMELEEEAGLLAEVEELESLGMIYPSKGSDTEIHLYAIDGAGRELKKPTGDGSKGEENAYVEWMNAADLLQKSNCPIVGCAFSRLIFK